MCIRDRLCNVLLAYGTQGLNAPAASMEHLWRVSQNISVGQYILKMCIRDRVSSYEREIMLQNENMEALRSFRHDMKRHFAEISVLASTGEIEPVSYTHLHRKHL